MWLVLMLILFRAVWGMMKIYRPSVMNNYRGSQSGHMLLQAFVIRRYSFGRDFWYQCVSGLEHCVSVGQEWCMWLNLGSLLALIVAWGQTQSTPLWKQDAGVALTSPLPNNWCNNTVNISAHIHTAIDLLPKRRARGNPAAQRQHPADDWHLLHLRLPFGWKAIWNHRAYGLYSKHHIVLFSLGAELVEHICIRIHKGSKEG